MFNQKLRTSSCSEPVWPWLRVSSFGRLSRSSAFLPRPKLLDPPFSLDVQLQPLRAPSHRSHPTCRPSRTYSLLHLLRHRTDQTKRRNHHICLARRTCLLLHRLCWLCRIFSPHRACVANLHWFPHGARVAQLGRSFLLLCSCFGISWGSTSAPGSLLGQFALCSRCSLLFLLVGCLLYLTLALPLPSG